MRSIQSLAEQGLINNYEKILLYPNIMVLTKTKKHYIVEFFGAVKKFNKFTIKHHKENSSTRYFNQFMIMNLTLLLRSIATMIYL